jgi:hypothetical protein
LEPLPPRYNNFAGNRENLPCRLSFRSSFDNIHATTALIKHHDAVDKGINGVIFSEPDATAWSPAGSALTNNDAAGMNRLTAVDFNAAPLTIRIATVATGTLTFLVSHYTTFTLYIYRTLFSRHRRRSGFDGARPVPSV